MNFYLNDDLLRYKKNIKNTVIGLIVYLVLTIVLNVVFCMLIGIIHHIAVQLINTFLSVACAFTIIYKIDTVIMPATKKIKHYKNIEAAPKIEFCGTVAKIGDVITVESGLKGREICLCFDKKSYLFYLLDGFVCDFDVDDKVSITVAKKFIINSLVIEKSEKGKHA